MFASGGFIHIVCFGVIAVANALTTVQKELNHLVEHELQQAVEAELSLLVEPKGPSAYFYLNSEALEKLKGHMAHAHTCEGQEDWHGHVLDAVRVRDGQEVVGQVLQHRTVMPCWCPCRCLAGALLVSCWCIVGALLVVLLVRCLLSCWCIACALLVHCLCLAGALLVPC